MLLHLIGISQTDTATIVYYNILNFPGGFPERIANFRTVMQYAKPDLILITELISDAGAQTLLSEGLNVYGETKYQKAPFIDGEDTDNMLFYNSEMFTLLSTDTIDTDLRAIGEYILYYNIPEPYTTQDTIFLNMYVAHLKSSTGSANEQQRLAEVMQFRQHIEAKSGLENIFFGGDFNLYTAAEPSYNALITADQYPLADVLPAGNWHDNETYAAYHTQSPRTTQFGGGANGGLDDRFDFMLFTSDLISGSNNVSYIPNSLKSIGNDGQHFNKSLLDIPANNLYPDSVVQAIYYMSDHLPLIGKFIVQPDVVPPSYELSVTAFLEGPFDGNQMTTSITEMLPLTSPFGQAPWNLPENPSVPSIPNNEIVDWVLVELRDAHDAPSAGSGTMVMQKAGFLLKNGSIVDLDGQSNLQFNGTISQQPFIVIRHRNHLGIMSALPMSLSGNTYSYNLSLSSGSAFSGGQKQLASGLWGMIAGDSDASGQINYIDKNINWKTESGHSGYLPGDFNLDGQIDNTDKNGYLIINFLDSSNIPQ